MLAIGGIGAIAGHHWQQTAQPSLPTVKAFTPGSPGYRETAASVRGPGAYRVIDGDTIEAPFGVKYRLLGFDTPEIFHSKCDAELELGMAAKERLEELLASGEVRVIESGRTGKWGRTLAHVEVDGRDVGEILIREGMARPYHGERRKSWCE
jgi:endonuclease YncB( thermonuclease family)